MALANEDSDDSTTTQIVIKRRSDDFIAVIFVSVVRDFCFFSFF